MMNCPKCGAPLEEDSLFCTACGANLSEAAESAPTAPDLAAPEQKEKKKLNIPEFKGDKSDKARRIGLIAGTLIMVIGLLRILTAGTSISSTSFGGDFYTYTYQGIVAVSEILASIEVSLGWILVAIGAAIDVSALRR